MHLRMCNWLGLAIGALCSLPCLTRSEYGRVIMTSQIMCKIALPLLSLAMTACAADIGQEHDVAQSAEALHYGPYRFVLDGLGSTRHDFVGGPYVTLSATVEAPGKIVARAYLFGAYLPATFQYGYGVNCNPPDPSVTRLTADVVTLGGGLSLSFECPQGISDSILEIPSLDIPSQQ